MPFCDNNFNSNIGCGNRKVVGGYSIYCPTTKVVNGYLAKQTNFMNVDGYLVESYCGFSIDNIDKYMTIGYDDLKSTDTSFKLDNYKECNYNTTEEGEEAYKKAMQKRKWCSFNGYKFNLEVLAVYSPYKLLYCSASYGGRGAGWFDSDLSYISIYDKNLVEKSSKYVRLVKEGSDPVTYRVRSKNSSFLEDKEINDYIDFLKEYGKVSCIYRQRYFNEYIDKNIRFPTYNSDGLVIWGCKNDN